MLIMLTDAETMLRELRVLEEVIYLRMSIYIRFVFKVLNIKILQFQP